MDALTIVLPSRLDLLSVDLGGHARLDKGICKELRFRQIVMRREFMLRGGYHQGIAAGVDIKGSETVVVFENGIVNETGPSPP